MTIFPGPISPAITRSDTRESLLDAAEVLFSERGYAGVGIREIVERAGANIAAINYHFGTKRALYLATVRRAMARNGAQQAWEFLREPERLDRADAAGALVRFIATVLRQMLLGDDRQTACQMILREAAQPSEALDDVLRDFIEPNHRLLTEAVRRLKPDLTVPQARLHAVGIMSQVLHYRLFRPFVQGLGIADLASPDEVDRIARHIARASLASLGMEGELIERSLRSVPSHSGPPNPPTPAGEPSAEGVSS